MPDAIGADIATHNVTASIDAANDRQGTIRHVNSRVSIVGCDQS